MPSAAAALAVGSGRCAEAPGESPSAERQPAAAPEPAAAAGRPTEAASPALERQGGEAGVSAPLSAAEAAREMRGSGWAEWVAAPADARAAAQPPAAAAAQSLLAPHAAAAALYADEPHAATTTAAAPAAAAEAATAMAAGSESNAAPAAAAEAGVEGKAGHGPGTWGISAHSDSELFTILHQDRTGLQVSLGPPLETQAQAAAESWCGAALPLPPALHASPSAHSLAAAADAARSIGGASSAAQSSRSSCCSQEGGLASLRAALHCAVCSAASCSGRGGLLRTLYKANAPCVRSFDRTVTERVVVLGGL